MYIIKGFSATPRKRGLGDAWPYHRILVVPSMSMRSPTVPSLLILIPGVVLVPDLTQGGTRSPQPRYSLPGFVALGEVISLAHDLDQRLVTRGESRSHEGVPTSGFSGIFLVTPSAQLRGLLAVDYRLVPMLDTWQWYRAVPKSEVAGG